MKTPDFFIDKAKEYSNSIEELLNNFLPMDINNVWNTTPEYLNQKRKFEDLVLGIKLLFSEFDNGQLFNDQITVIEKNGLFMFREDERLKEYKHILSLFIDHVIEFRK